MIDAMKTIKDAVVAALILANPNTKPTYPQGLFSEHAGIQFPLTVYEVELSNGRYNPGSKEMRRIDVEVRVDHFGETRAAVSTVAQNALEDMMVVMPGYTMDNETPMPNGLVRRSQRFTGVYDTGDNIIYAR